jgi:hypothetical protein
MPKIEGQSISLPYMIKHAFVFSSTKLGQLTGAALVDSIHAAALAEQRQGNQVNSARAPALHPGTLN